MYRYLILCGLLLMLFSGHAAAQPWLEAYEKEAEPLLLQAYQMRDQKKMTQFVTANFKRHWNQLLPIAQSGDSVAQYYLARQYEIYSLLINLSAYEKEAVQWAQKSSDQGYPPAHSLRTTLDRKMLVVFDCFPKEKNEHDAACKQKIGYAKKAAEGGVLADLSISLFEAKSAVGDTNENMMSRNYVWRRLQLDFSPPAGWAGWQSFPAQLREEFETSRKESEDVAKMTRDFVKTSLGAEKIAKLDKEYVEKNASIKQVIMQWKARYPALLAGAHGWYAK
jgi:hypothetical protein